MSIKSFSPSFITHTPTPIPTPAQTPIPTPTHTPILPKPSPEAMKKTSTSTLIKNMQNKIQQLEKTGKIHGAVTYNEIIFIQSVAYVALLMEYQAKCTIIEKDFHSSIFVGCHAIKCDMNKKLYKSAEKIAKNLLDCIHRGEKLISIPIFIKDDTDIGHANMLFYRPHQHTIERFEPHGTSFLTTDSKEDKVINHVLKELFEVRMKPFLKEYTPTYSSPDQICPSIYGLQELEQQISGPTKEGGGFCAMWSLFVMELMFLNPNMNTKEIIEVAYNTSQQDPQYLKNVIRGYVINTEKLLDTYMKNIDQTASFNYAQFSPFYNKKNKIQNQLLDLLLSYGSKSTLIEDLRGSLFSPKTKAELRKAIEVYMHEKRKGIPHTNGNINTWDVSNIKDMSNLFHGIHDFNEYIQGWNMLDVTDTSHMFHDCAIFNQPLNEWQMYNVKDLSHMFHGCTEFNQPLHSWQTYDVINMSHMFYGCAKFNQYINSWYIYDVTDTSYMFYGCTNFNSYLGKWFLLKIQNTVSMFEGCKSFDKELPWKYYGIDNIPHDNMFRNAKMSYDEIMRDMFIPITNDELRNAVIEYVKENNPPPASIKPPPSHHKTSSKPYHRNGDINNWYIGNIKELDTLLLCHNSVLRGLSGMTYQKVKDEIQTLQTFNENINEWFVNGITNMESMFLGCKSFNQPLDHWNVEKVTNMESMFAGCTNFKQKLPWKKYNIDNKPHNDMFADAGITYEDAIVYDGEDEPDDVYVYSTPKKSTPTPPKNMPKNSPIPIPSPIPSPIDHKKNNNTRKKRKLSPLHTPPPPPPPRTPILSPQPSSPQPSSPQPSSPSNVAIRKTKKRRRA